jgi:hypothetical protein
MRKSCAEECPVILAYAQYAIEQDIQPGDVAYKEIFAGLTLMDQRKLEAITAKDIPGLTEGEARSLNARDCSGGPRKTCFGLGKKACQANLAFFAGKRDGPIIT